MIGIKHIEFWVSDMDRSLRFYEPLFSIIGWEKVVYNAFSGNGTKIYFIEQPVRAVTSAGPRHLCFYAADRTMVDQVGLYIKEVGMEVIRGPVEISEPLYSPRYYTVDFKDPDGYILEVAHSPE